MGAPLFMPPSVRSRTELELSAPRRSAQHVNRDTRWADQRRALDNALLWSIGVTVALSILAFCTFASTRDTEAGESVVALWVAGVAMTLVLGLCLLCAVLAHREMHHLWAPIGALAIPVLLGVYLILRLN